MRHPLQTGSRLSCWTCLLIEVSHAPIPPPSSGPGSIPDLSALLTGGCTYG